MAAAESGCEPQSRNSDMLRGIGNRLCGPGDTVYRPVYIAL